jgi:hypothetical protein
MVQCIACCFVSDAFVFVAFLRLYMREAEYYLSLLQHEALKERGKVVEEKKQTEN